MFTEPGFETIGDIPADKMHWHYIPPAGRSWSSMADSADLVNELSFDAVAKMVDPKRQQYNQFVSLLKSLNNFVCDRNEIVYGDVCTWGTDRAIVLDGLSGVGVMAMGLVVGGKPSGTKATGALRCSWSENLIQKLCTDTQCHFILIGHAERETDEVMGGSRIMAATLGRKPRGSFRVSFLTSSWPTNKEQNSAGPLPLQVRTSRPKPSCCGWSSARFWPGHYELEEARWTYDRRYRVNLVLIELPEEESFVIDLEKITCIIPTTSGCEIGYDDQSELEVHMSVNALFSASQSQLA